MSGLSDAAELNVVTIQDFSASVGTEVLQITP